jgi:RHS repeat-associated protein
VIWQYDFDARGRTTEALIPSSDTAAYKYLPGPVAIKYTYDTVGHLASISQNLGGKHFSYDTSERLQSVANTNSSGTSLDTETIGYDIASELSAIVTTCTGGNTACGIGSVLGATTPAYFQSNYLYDSSGVVNSFAPTPVQGNTTSVPTPAPTATVLSYWQYKSTYTYDSNGNPSSALNYCAFMYDGPQCRSGIDPTYTYDGFHQLTSYSEGVLQPFADNLTDTITYDSQHNVQSMTPVGQSGMVFAHDDFGHVTSVTSSVSGLWKYLYDGDGNVTSISDPNGAATTITYDALNRPLKSVSTLSSKSESVVESYDSATVGAFGIGRLSTVTDPTGTTTFSYEPRGLVATESRVVNGFTYGTSYTYDSDGDIATMTMPSGRVLTYGYDYAHRPTSLSGLLGGVTTKYITGALYLPFGPRVQLSYGNGLTQTWTYNQRYLPYENKIVGSSGSLSDVVYSEDNLGEITAIWDQLKPTYDRTQYYGPAVGSSSNAVARLLTGSSTGTALWGTAAYANQASTTTNGEDLTSEQLGATTLGLTYDVNDHLSGVSTNGGAAVVAAVDAAGNHTKLNSSVYSYSPRNLLAAGDGFTFGYDAFGQRVTTSATGLFQASLYDRGGHLVSESSLTSGSPLYDYIWFGGTPVAQETIGSPSSSVLTHTNEFGAPFLQTSPSGAITWQADYTPYGSIYDLRVGSQTTHQPLRLPGQEALMFPSAKNQNGSSQLFYNHRRWYVPSIGRYLTADPAGLSGDPFNQYVYAGDNPTAYIDPSGLEITPVTWAAVGGEEAAGLGPEDPVADAFALATLATAAMTPAASTVAENPGLVSSAESLGESAVEGGGAEGAGGSFCPLSPEDGAAPAAYDAGEQGPTLFRGVASNSPAYEDALNGTAIPRGGPATMIDHIAGDTDSPFTSWTSDYDIALGRATDNFSIPGVVLTNEFQAGTAVPIPANLEAFFGESEYLTQEPVTGATVQRVRF